MMLIIENGRVIDPANKRDEIANIFIDDGKICKFDEGEAIDATNVKRIDASGLVVVPGLIDIHVHLRVPGQSHKETIESGARAAAYGGFTTVVCMANTTPVVDNPETVQWIIREAEKKSIVNVFPTAKVTVDGSATDTRSLLNAGAVALSDDGKPVMNAKLMHQALKKSAEDGFVIFDHAEDPNLSENGVMNQGSVSERLGLRGIPNISEAIMVARDIMLAEDSNGRLHILHLTTTEAVELVRHAKARDVFVTGEACPHHFTLTDEAVLEHRTYAKMSPPLRSSKDVEAVIEGLKDGTIDVIATDHAPHTVKEKGLDMNEAPFGIIGLETCVPLVMTKLVHKGHLQIAEAIAKMTINPARILSLDKGTLSAGADADITLIDMELEKQVNASSFQSKARNTPFDGWRLKGWPVMTIVNGNIVFDALTHSSQWIDY